MSLVRHALAIAGKDLRVEVRSRHAVGVLVPFAATLLIAFGISVGPGRTLLRQVAPGLLWLAVLFAAILAVRRAYAAEAEDGALEGLLLAPIDKAAVFIGKAAAVGAQLLVLEAAALLLVAGLFDLSLGAAPVPMAGAFLLGTVGLAAVGSLFGILTEAVRAREAVFPLLVLPLATPILIAGIRATALATAGRGGEAGSWLGLLLAFDVVFVAAGILVFAQLMED